MISRVNIVEHTGTRIATLVVQHLDSRYVEQERRERLIIGEREGGMEEQVHE
jgi:hypothetical protein